MKTKEHMDEEVKKFNYKDYKTNAKLCCKCTKTWLSTLLEELQRSTAQVGEYVQRIAKNMHSGNLVFIEEWQNNVIFSLPQPTQVTQQTCGRTFSGQTMFMQNNICG
ncbi:hypothetical protein CHARACLAT_013855 [Characodon lateralis]|uniref:Uncharacterized protein n=1 Tax=Characodon lateralis TaxID=208331 RepID=A0ABU7CNH4_9TELE|nr:hypothetical protein [Characodon lateralis]